MKSNLWIPYVDTFKKVNEIKTGELLVIIPTALINIRRLASCIETVLMAGEGLSVKILIVICPVDHISIERIKEINYSNIKVIKVDGNFNYCNSINIGCKEIDDKTSSVLFVNDDVNFINKGDISKLHNDLFREGWACIGPRIKFNPFFIDNSWPENKSSLNVINGNSLVRKNIPLSGCCMLWDKYWLKKIGPLDEKFGIGWGLDEADLCLRVIRKGGRYGRNENIEIIHEMHGTFGNSYTKYSGDARTINLRYFQKKYGDGIDESGRGIHWWPLPGIQIILFSDLNINKLFQCLKNLNEAFDGYPKILKLVLPDVTPIELNKLISCLIVNKYDAFFMYKWDQKKFVINSLCHITEKYKQLYPAIYYMHENLEIDISIIDKLLWRIRDLGYLGGCICDNISSSTLNNKKFVKPLHLINKNKDLRFSSNTIFNYKYLQHPN